MITEGGGTFPPGTPAVSGTAAPAVAENIRIPRLAQTKFFIILNLTGFQQYYFPHFSQSATSSSSHRRSSSSKVFKAVLSMSNTATTSSRSKTGTTISERDKLLQAM